MDGILLIDKPENITSNRLVQKIRKHLKKITGRDIKVGHTGTLDFFASGLMIITVGKGTKITEYLQGLDKEYVATGELGKITDTYDRQGKVIQEKPYNITQQELEKIVLSFRKTYMQTPPPYSAKRIKGTRAYKLAKKGLEVPLKPKKVTIYQIQLLDFSPPEFTIRVFCSSGTYIRSIIKEIGDLAGCGAYTKKLRRTKIGDFSVDRATELEKFLTMTESETESILISVKDALYFMPEIVLDKGFDRRFTMGQRFKVPFQEKGTVKVLDRKLNLLGIGKVKEEGVLQPVKVFYN